MTRKIVLAALMFYPLLAQQPAGKDLPPFIRVTGEASVSAPPDQVEINIGVVTEAPSAADAGAQNAKQAASVISALRDILGQAADIKTLNYSLTPLQRYPKNGGSPTIAGYGASNTVHVRTENLAAVGKVIDSVTKSGANEIQRVQFTLHDDQPVRAQALRQAAQQARASGDVLASALGLHVVRVMSVDTSQPASVRPFEMPLMARAAAAAVTTPVEPGTVDVHATVVLTLEVAP